MKMVSRLFGWLISNLFLILIVVSLTYIYVYWDKPLGKGTPVGKVLAKYPEEVSEAKNFISGVTGIQLDTDNASEPAAETGQSSDQAASSEVVADTSGLAEDPVTATVEAAGEVIRSAERSGQVEVSAAASQSGDEAADGGNGIATQDSVATTVEEAAIKAVNAVSGDARQNVEPEKDIVAQGEPLAAEKDAVEKNIEEEVQVASDATRADVVQAVDRASEDSGLPVDGGETGVMAEEAVNTAAETAVATETETSSETEAAAAAEIVAKDDAETKAETSAVDETVAKTSQAVTDTSVADAAFSSALTATESQPEVPVDPDETELARNADTSENASVAMPESVASTFDAQVEQDVSKVAEVLDAAVTAEPADEAAATGGEAAGESGAEQQASADSVYVPPEIESALNQLHNDGSVEDALAMQQVDKSAEQLIIDARNAFYRRDYEASIGAYKQLIANDKGNYDAYGELGNVYFTQGNMELAAEAYYQAATILISRGDVQRAASLVGFLSSVDAEKAKKLGDLLRQDKP